MSVHRSIGLIGIIFALASCAGSGPYRNATDDFVSTAFEDRCQRLYGDTDDAILEISTNFSKSDADRDAFLTRMHDTIDNTPEEGKSCWKTAYEHHSHAKYDLYYAEFDDAGQATDMARGAAYQQSELYLIERSILKALGDDKDIGLNIVVFTHGWHGNARADNNYSIEFKAILQDIVAREDAYTASVGKSFKNRIPHRILGIEIAWRGDSFLTPALPFYPESENAANVWDRKLAAETLSTGAVQELLAFLNEVYLDNSCHGTQRNRKLSAKSCDRVHMLSIGHSFGALINYRALVPRLESGLNVRPCYRVYGFGDMTILLNPAFEGARYRGLFNNAMDRPALIGPYYGDGRCDPSTVSKQKEVQIPSIVTLQSLGDTATGNFFPIFRTLTTPFAQTLSDQEESDKDGALGWVLDFRTHALTLTQEITDDECVNVVSAVESFCPFRAHSAVRTDQQVDTRKRWMRLSWQPGTGSQKFPNYMPLWSVAVDSEIMKDHDDIWNPQIVRLISILFTDAYVQTERLHGGGEE